jgi:hypothetical protein
VVVEGEGGDEDEEETEDFVEVGGEPFATVEANEDVAAGRAGAGTVAGAGARRFGAADLGIVALVLRACTACQYKETTERGEETKEKEMSWKRRKARDGDG